MIRNIQQNDAETIKNICESELGHSASVDCIRQQTEILSQNDNYFIKVFEDDDTHRVLGFIQAEKYSLLYGENGFNVIALAVTREFQGRGIGKQLLFSLEDHTKNLGYAFVRLNSNVVRTEAHEFYLHLGYRCDKLQKRFIKNFVL